jgi:hypothetical protein
VALVNFLPKGRFVIVAVASILALPAALSKVTNFTLGSEFKLAWSVR